MEDFGPGHDGAFARMLPDSGAIMRFAEEVVLPLKEHEARLEAEWRLGFRAQLPFYRLLDGLQQRHLRAIFQAVLPDPDILVTEYSRQGKVELDVLAETYVGQTDVFSELMNEFEYQVARMTRRDARGRIIALSLSGSVFFLDSPGPSMVRTYRYGNIYGNIQVDPEGSCSVKGHPRVGHRLRTDCFTSSPVMLLAVDATDVADEADFRSHSGVIRLQMSQRVEEISRDSWHGLSGEFEAACNEGTAEGEPSWETGVHDIDEDPDDPSSSGEGSGEQSDS